MLAIGPDILKSILIRVYFSIVYEGLIETRHKKRKHICIKFNVRGCQLFVLSLMSMFNVVALKSLPVHSFNALIIPILRGCLQSFFNIPVP